MLAALWLHPLVCTHVCVQHTLWHTASNVARQNFYCVNDSGKLHSISKPPFPLPSNQDDTSCLRGLPHHRQSHSVNISSLCSPPHAQCSLISFQCGLHRWMNRKGFFLEFTDAGNGPIFFSLLSASCRLLTPFINLNSPILNGLTFSLFLFPTFLKGKEIECNSINNRYPIETKPQPDSSCHQPWVF